MNEPDIASESSPAVSKQRSFANADLFDPSSMLDLLLDEIEANPVQHEQEPTRPASTSAIESLLPPPAKPPSRSSGLASFPTTAPPSSPAAPSIAAPPPTAPRSRRLLVANELLKTEESYVAILATLQRDFLEPLCRAEGMPTYYPVKPAPPATPPRAGLLTSPSSSSNISSTSSSSSLSSSGPPPVKHRFPIFLLTVNSIEELLGIHESWARELDRRMIGWNEATTCIGEVLLKLVPQLGVYISFVNNFTQVMKGLAELQKKNRKFNELMLSLQSEANKLITGMTGFSTLMIAPIQRIPRYLLLFSELARNTEAGHPDHEHIQQAAAAIEKMTGHIDQEKEREEQNRRLQTLIKGLEGDLTHLRQSVMQIRQSQLRTVSKQKKAHAWKNKDFRSPRWCCFCHGAILDASTGKFSGYHCKTCNVSAHKPCLPKVPPVCGVVENDDFGGDRTLLLESSSPIVYEAIFARDTSGKAKRAINCMMMLFDDALLCVEPRGSSSNPKARHNLICMIKWFSRLTKRHIETLASPAVPTLSILPPRENDVLHQFTFVSMAERDHWHFSILETIKLFGSLTAATSPSPPIRAGSSGRLPVGRRQV